VGYSLWNSLYTIINETRFYWKEKMSVTELLFGQSASWFLLSLYVCVRVCGRACLGSLIFQPHQYRRKLLADGKTLNTSWTGRQANCERGRTEGGGGKRNGKTNRDSYKRCHGAEEGHFCIILVEARRISVFKLSTKMQLKSLYKKRQLFKFIHHYRDLVKLIQFMGFRVYE
jgi:hypothetical protein